MTWDMIMRLPIQERRALIHKHNIEAEAAEKSINSSTNSGEMTRRYEGEEMNEIARRQQNA